MKIARQSYERSHIGTEWDYEDLRITIQFDEGELNDPRLFKRFGSVEINQRQYKTDKHPKTWMKGCHSAWFGEHQLNDLQKKFIWDLLNRFMEENPNAISVNWKLNKH